MAMTATLLASPAILCFSFLPSKHYYGLLFDGENKAERYCINTAEFHVFFWASSSCTVAYFVYELLDYLIGMAPRLVFMLEKLLNRVFSEAVINNANNWAELSSTMAGAISILLLAGLSSILFTLDDNDMRLVATAGAVLNTTANNQQQQSQQQQQQQQQPLISALGAVNAWTKGARFMALAALTNLIARIISQQIAHYFYREFYQERFEHSVFAMRCVRELRERFGRDLQAFNTRHQSPHGMDRSESPLSSATATSIMSVVSSMTSQQPVNIMDDVDVDNHAEVSRFARLLFSNLVEAESLDEDSSASESASDVVVLRQKMTVGHLIPVLGEEKGHLFFSALDVGKKGDLGVDEFVEAIEDILQEEARLDKSIESNNKIIKKLSRLLFLVSFFVLLLLAAPVLSSGLLPSMATLGTVLLTFQFVFSSEISDAFKGLFFVIVSHPFDIDDEISIEDEPYIVEEIGLLTTQLRGAEDGQKTYMTNSCLAGYSIHNVRRSGPMCETIHLELNGASTDNEALLSFESELNAQLRQFNRDFDDNKVYLGGFNLLNSEVLQTSFGVSHRSNFQDRPLRSKRSKLIAGLVRAALQKSNVELAKMDWNGRWAY